MTELAVHLIGVGGLLAALELAAKWLRRSTETGSGESS